MSDRFELEGTTYYQQGRKCGKPGCHCQNGGALHGPYWYSRNEHGRRGYVGRELPEHIARAREVHARRLGDMQAERARLRRELDAVSKLTRKEGLSDGDRSILVALGFGDCLVPAGALQETQGR